MNKQDLTKQSVESLLELSHDIDMHEHDRRWAARGATILYVFDQNVFELFIAPYQHWRQVLFTADSLSNVDSVRQTALQSALVTGEDLLSGDLPGQQGGAVYVTEWHHSEFLDRLGDWLVQGSRALGEASAHDSLMSKLRVWMDETKHGTPAEKSGRDAPVDRMLADDVRSLEAYGYDQDFLRTFSVNRLATLELATDELTEPLQQVGRLISEEFRRRLRVLPGPEEYRPTERDKAQISRNAEDWAVRLQRELRSREFARTPRAPRAIWNDARSLAYVAWLSETLGNSNGSAQLQVVFVTGDRALTRAYGTRFNEREWKTEQPFLLRRIRQYSPLFRFGSEMPLAREGRALFLSIQWYAEIALLPVRLSAVLDNRPVTLPYQSSKLEELLGASGISASELYAELVPFGERWNRAERMLVGHARKQLINRLDSEQIALFERTHGDSELQEREFRKYIEAIVTRVSESAVRVLVPIAEACLRSALSGELSERFGQHVPICVERPVGSAEAGWAFLHATSVKEDMTNTIPLTAVDHASIADLLLASVVIFIRTGQWRQAERMAVTTSNAQHLDDAAPGQEGSVKREAAYLSALAARYRLGALVDVASDSEVRQALSMHQSAEALLKKSVRVPSSQFGSFRCATEGCALEQFLALVLWVPGGHSLRESVSMIIEMSVSRSAEHLNKCKSIIQRSDSALSMDSPDLYERRLVEQYLLGVFAHSAIRTLVGYEAAKAPGALELLTGDWEDGIRKLEVVLRARNAPLPLALVLAFRLSIGLDARRAKRELTQLIGDDRIPPPLAVEKKLLSAVFDRYS